MKKESVILYCAQYEALRNLSNEQMGALFHSVFHWLNDEPVETETWMPIVEMAFNFLTLQFSLDSEKYLQKCKHNKQKWKERNQQNKDPNVNSVSQSEQVTRTRDNNENDNDNENENENVSLSFFSKNPKNEEKDEKQKEKNKEEKIQSFIKFWNDAIDSSGSRMRKVRILTPERRQRIEAIIETFPGKDAGTAINYAMRSQYCNGETQRRAKPVDFDWLIRLENFTKALEGSL